MNSNATANRIASLNTWFHSKSDPYSSYRTANGRVYRRVFDESAYGGIRIYSAPLGYVSANSMLDDVAV